VGITFDLTKQKRAEEALRRSEKLATAGQLIATIAHEINNPLESILNLIHLAKGTEELPSCVKEYLDLAVEEVERASNISRNTLGLHRDSTTPVDFAVNDALGTILHVYKKKALKRHVQLSADWEQNLRFRGLPGTLKQIVTNLVSNALDAVDEKGRVLVRVHEAVRKERAGLLITIADDGPGIPKANRDQVFEAFFTTKEETGTGLGLWVTRELVVDAGGEIAFKSSLTGSHRGTTFHVFLPRMSSEVKTTLPSTAHSNHKAVQLC
jgi:signal transduction histidine kinase